MREHWYSVHPLAPNQPLDRTAGMSAQVERKPERFARVRSAAFRSAHRYDCGMMLSHEHPLLP